MKSSSAVSSSFLSSPSPINPSSSSSAPSVPSGARPRVIGDTDTYILHNKPVSLLDFNALDALPNTDAKLRENMISMRRYIHDDELIGAGLRHLNRTAEGCPHTSVRDDFIDELLTTGHITEISRREVKGWVKYFVIPEHFKMRYRSIRETADLNSVFGPESLCGIEFPKKEDICNLVLEGSHALALDMMAWYDQFSYTKKVSEYLCFRKGNRYFRQNRLCMGQRQGCDIGQTTTLFLLDFEGRRCKKVYAYIDNVIFVGSKEDVLHDAAKFLERCKIANATINEAAEIAEKGLEAMVSTSLDWCGVSLDFTNKTAKLIDKTIKKLELSWLSRTSWTYRQFSAHIGLLFWTWGIIDIPLYSFYSLLKFISAASIRMQEKHDTEWDTPCNVPMSAMPALEKWTQLAFENTPRQVKRSSSPAWLVCTDASAWGWGYRAFNYATGEIRRYGQQWSREDKAGLFSIKDGHKRSVYAEPRAVQRSLFHLFSSVQPATSISFVDAAKDLLPPNSAPEERVKIFVATDNSATQATLNAGFASRSYDINQTITEIKRRFPDSHFDIDVYFVPGKFNPGDKPSRGLKDDVNAITGKNVDDENLRRMAGFGPSNGWSFSSTPPVLGNAIST